jgi:hypothetical protein
LEKLELDFEEDYEFEIISIVASIKSYRLCAILHKVFDLDFTREPDLEIAFKKKKVSRFDLFRYTDEIDKMDYYLIGNKSQSDINEESEKTALLLPELKMVDFIIKLEGFLATEKKAKLVQKLKQDPNIQTIIDTPINELKNKINLLF